MDFPPQQTMTIGFEPQGRARVRKQIIKPHPATPVQTPGEINIAAVATVMLTSETPEHSWTMPSTSIRDREEPAGSPGSRVSRS
jgi:hypothetical protein